MMTSEEIRDRFSGLRVWQKGGQRAPHKPLLVLYALGRLTGGSKRLIPYSEIDDTLASLLREFGPHRKSVHPEYPFWRLQSDGVWVVPGGDQLEAREGNTDPRRTELLQNKTLGGFSEEVFTALCKDPDLLRSVAMDLLDSHFSETMHKEILQAVGLDLDRSTTRRASRDSTFRPRVLTAYEYRCAVCRTDIRLGTQSLGIEAAHIKWHQAGGPDTEPNGLALCSMHHKLLDFGAIGISSDRKVLVSENARGSEGFDDWVMRFNGANLASPVNPDYESGGEYIDWHSEQVFKGPARPI